MKVKALVSFVGAFSMYKGEEKECNDEVILLDLLKARYVEEVRKDIYIEDKEIKEVKEDTKSSGRKKKVKANED